MTQPATERRPRRRSIGQADIARAIRGASQAGIDVREVIVTKDSVRLLSVTSSTSTAPNSWDEVLGDG